MLEKTKQWINNNRAQYTYGLFVFKLIVFYFVWDYAMYEWVNNQSYMLALNEYLAHSSSKLLALLGFKATSIANQVYIDGTNVVNIGSACNGIGFLGLILAFIFSTPTPLINKLLFIPLSIFIVFMLNILRIGLLAINYKFWPSTFEFNHKYIFLYSVYFLVFWIWYLWFQNTSHKIAKV